LSKEELKELILEQLADASIGTETIEVEIVDGPQVILRGKVDFSSERRMIKAIIMDVDGIDDIVDELVVIRGVSDGTEDETRDLGSVPYDEDEEFVGTEDVFQSVENGVPYIPPTSPTYQESPKNIRWKKKKTNA
jgi:hypothetical protein